VSSSAGVTLSTKSQSLEGRGASTVRDDGYPKHCDPEGYLCLQLKVSPISFTLMKNIPTSLTWESLLLDRTGSLTPGSVCLYSSPHCCDSWHNFHNFKGKFRDARRWWSKELSGQAVPS